MAPLDPGAGERNNWRREKNASQARRPFRVAPDRRSTMRDSLRVDNKPAYTNFLDIWDDPEFDPVFIWLDNLVLDNLVLVRGRIDS